MIRLARFMDLPERKPSQTVYRFALYDPCNPLNDPEFVGPSFQLQRRHLGHILQHIQVALDMAEDGRVVVLLPWQAPCAQEARAA